MGSRFRLVLRSASAALAACCLPYAAAYPGDAPGYAAPAVLPPASAPFDTAAGAMPRTTVRPVDHGGALLNPGMGWSFNFYANSTDHFGADGSDSLRNGDDVLESFPGCGTVFFRLGWSFFERHRQGGYDWHRIDSIGMKWVARGRKLAFSFVAYDPYYPEKPPYFSNTPPWVRKAGAGGRWVQAVSRPGNGDSLRTRREAPPGAEGETWSWAPDYGDPVFLSKLDAFLAAAARRYDGKPYVDFVEIGTIGTWGEGHTWPGNDKVPLAVLKRHIDVWSRNFRKTRVLVPDEFGPEAVEYARGKGLGMVDHSIGAVFGNPSPHLAQRFWPDLPVALENQNNSPPREVDRRAVEAYHASYIRLNAPVDKVRREGMAAVREINRRLGYRLQVVEASWPSRARAGDTVEVRMTLRNAGVAPCYRGGFPWLVLRDGEGRQHAAVRGGLDVKTLRPGPWPEAADAEPVAFAFRIPSPAEPGEWSWWFSVGDTLGGPAYALPYGESDGGLRYRLGGFRIVPDR